MRKISNDVRDEAIEALLCCADCYIMQTPEDGRGSEDAEAITWDLLRAVWHATKHSLDVATDCLEAAALLRDGWSPGDPVVRRGGGS